MFTGIIEHIGTITQVKTVPGGRRLGVDLGPVAEGVRIGDSIAVQGACLTVTRLRANLAEFDLSSETCERTTLGAAVVGSRVNHERALRMGDRLGGHLVSGHVDGIGTVQAKRARGAGCELVIRLPPGRQVAVIEKGSLCLDGISLTTFACSATRATIALIPHTLASTTLGQVRVGARCNLEQDLIGRWVERMLGPGRTRSA